MKRSEMISILQKSFIHWMNSPELGYPSNDSELYDAVLGDLEMAGMLPPQVNNQKESDLYDSYGMKCHFKWESE